MKMEGTKTVKSPFGGKGANFNEYLYAGPNGRPLASRK